MPIQSVSVKSQVGKNEHENIQTEKHCKQKCANVPFQMKVEGLKQSCSVPGTWT